MLAFSVYESWFGPVPARFDGALIDGRIRVRVCASVGARVPRARELRSPEDAIRWLLVAGHNDRAFALCADAGIDVDDLLGVRLGIPTYVVAPLVTRKRKHVARPHDRKRGQRWDAFVTLAQSAKESNRLLVPDEALAFLLGVE